MRNWNFSGRGSFCSHNLFSAYLWGIETPHQASLGRQNSNVFSLPMRNWNTEVTKPVRQGSTVLSLPMRNWNIFYLLLRPPGEKFSAYLWGIETLSISLIASPALSVFSLPMRNWNPKGESKFASSNPFSAYLWGIETTLKTAGIWNIERFSAYLWGIETGLKQGSSGKGWWFSAYLWGIETFDCPLWKTR